MARKRSIIPKAPTEWEKLQRERETIQARLANKLVFLGDLDRQALGLRLIEIKRALNRLYSSGT